MRKSMEKNIEDPRSNPMYHNTWKLLKKYRDVVWSLETAVQQVKKKFAVEYGSSIEEFLDTVYLAGANLSGSDIERRAKSIERSYKMLQLVQSSIDVIRNKHKYGEEFYWILYYTFLSPQELRGVEEVIEQLRPHIHNISQRTYYRKRQDAMEALSSVLWGYTSRECIDILDRFFPEEPSGT